MTFKIDGIKMRMEAPDLDGDGASGGVERIQRDASGILQMRDTTELGQALEHQNKDEMNQQRLSSVDFVARINEYQLAPLAAVDAIVSMGVLSEKSRMIVRSLMRKTVSIQGKGRAEFVDVVTGKKQNEQFKQMSMHGLPQK